MVKIEKLKNWYSILIPSKILEFDRQKRWKCSRMLESIINSRSKRKYESYSIQATRCKILWIDIFFLVIFMTFLKLLSKNVHYIIDYLIHAKFGYVEKYPSYISYIHANRNHQFPIEINLLLTPVCW